MAAAPRRFRTLLASEASVSEVLATTLLTGLTVVLLGGFGAVLLASVGDAHDPVPASFALRADAGASSVLLTLMDGGPVRLDGARVVLVVDGDDLTGAQELAAPAAPGVLAQGGSLRVHLASGTLAEGARVGVLVADRESNKPHGVAVATVQGPTRMPAYVASEPSVDAVAVDPAVLTVDGQSLATLTARVSATHGLRLVHAVTVDLTPLGGSSQAPLRDDGEGGDALAGDGVWTARVAALAHAFEVMPSVETVRLDVAARDVLGKTATGEAVLSVRPAPMSKVAPGAQWRDLPASDEVRWVNLTGFTFRDPALLDGDQVQVRVSDLSGTAAWTALVSFGSPATCGGQPGVASVRLARDDAPGSVLYVPSPGPCLSLGALTQLDLADVTASLDAGGAPVAWSVTGDVATHVYAAAGLGGSNEATVTFLGDAVSPSPSALGFGQADLTWARTVPNLPPTAGLAATPTTGTAPLAVDLTLSGSDPDGAVASWSLAYGDGAHATGVALPAALAKTYAASGAYQATLTVVDDRGATRTATVAILVAQAPNVAPAASLAVTSTDGLLVEASGAASSDPDGSVVSWTWDWGDGATETTAVPTASHAYATGGTYGIGLTVTDDRGATSPMATATATPNRPPVLAGVSETALADLNVTLAASATDPDGQPLAYAFAWGDATPPTTGADATASHAYAFPGNHTVTVWANDTLGGSARATRVVSVAQTVYAAPADVSFAAPGGVAAGIANVTAADGAFVELTETSTGGTIGAVTGCDATFTTSAPLSCTLSALTWKVNATSTGGTAGWTLALDASQGTPTADGALAFGPTANGANTGRLNHHFNLTGAAGTTLTRLSLDWKMTANGGSGLRSITAVLVAPNGTAVTIGTASTTSTTGWGTFTGGVPDDFLAAPGTYLLRIDHLSSKNGDVLNLDNLRLEWTSTHAYRLQKELSVAPVATAAGLTHHLEVAARQAAGAEPLRVQVFDGAAWTTRATVSTATPTTYAVMLSPADVATGQVRVRLVDATVSADATASSWLVDHVRVVSRGA